MGVTDPRGFGIHDRRYSDAGWFTIVRFVGDPSNPYSQTLAFGTVSMVFGFIEPCVDSGTSSSISTAEAVKTGTSGVFQGVLYETAIEVSGCDVRNCCVEEGKQSWKYYRIDARSR